MEKEVKELLDAETVNDVNNVNKSSKGTFLGITATIAASVLLFKFRKKIGSKIDKIMVNKLTKKGYTVCTPEDIANLSEDLLEEIH